MFNVELSTRECDGRVVVGLRGELDVADAVSVAASLAAIAAGHPQVIIDLAGLEFIDSSGSPDIHQPPSATAALTHKEPL